MASWPRLERRRNDADEGRDADRGQSLMLLRLLLSAAIILSSAAAFAQQRPLVTEDPEPIGAGRILVEGGVDGARDQRYTTSGLRGNLWRIATIGFSFGLSSIAEFQIDGGLHDHLSITSRDPTAPLASLVTATGTSTGSIEDAIIGTKI